MAYRPHAHSSPSPHAFRRGAGRTVLLSVVALAMIIAGLAIFAFKGQTPGTTAQQGQQPPTGRVVEELLSGDDIAGTGMVIQIADKDDPTRLAAEIIADRYDPDGPTIRLVEKPKAWLFGDDGSAWLIESDRGRFYIPQGEEQPREGTLTGNVTARRFDPDPTGEAAEPGNARRPDPDLDPPALIATTDEPLRFNLDILNFETDGRLRVTTPALEFVGRGAFVVLNESQESISTLRVDQGERIVYTPRSDSPQPQPEQADPGDTESAALPKTVPGPRPTPSEQTVADRGTPASTGPTDQIADQPKIDHYRITFSDNVRAEAGPRIITADQLSVWTRLLDNKLPTGPTRAKSGSANARGPIEAALIAMLAVQDDPVYAAEDSGPFPTPPSGDGSAPAQQPEAATDEQQPVVLTWDGPLVVEPLSDSPRQLDRGDDLALRFEANDGEVEIRDSEADATANALAATYFAQRERVELEGSGGSIVLESPGTGRIEGMNAVEIELAAGVITIPTAGELFGAGHTEASADPEPQNIAWSEAASFVFAVEDGAMTGRLERAGFRGRVRARSKDATVDGDTLLALFDTPEGGSPRLLQLNIEGALAEDGRGGSVGGEGMEVHFARGTYGEDIDPTRAILTGDAFARRDGLESIVAQWIDASLARDEDANVIVTTAEARGDVRFDDGAGTEARGETLIADALNETATITSPDEPRTAWVSRDGTRITGPDIRMDGGARSVEVFGPGRFSHGGGNATGRAARPIDASWTGRMSFDDLAGTVLCLGGVETVSPGPDGTIDTVTGDRLTITLTPIDPDAAEPDADRLRFAEVFGSPENPARAESRKDADPDAAPGDSAIESLYRLEGAKIRFAAADDRIEVPTAGRFFILDHSPADAEPQPEGDADPLLGADGSRGTTLMTWSGSMDFDRAAGRAVFRDEARVVNKPLGEPNPSEVIANTITAAFATPDEGGGEPTPSGSSGDLRWAIAEGDALLRIEDRREILGDRLIYNPEAGKIQAVGENGRRIEITDLLRGTTTNARAVIWDLATDRITITSPGAIVAPE